MEMKSYLSAQLCVCVRVCFKWMQFIWNKIGIYLFRSLSLDISVSFLSFFFLLCFAFKKRRSIDTIRFMFCFCLLVVNIRRRQWRQWNDISYENTFVCIITINFLVFTSQFIYFVSLFLHLHREKKNKNKNLPRFCIKENKSSKKSFRFGSSLISYNCNDIKVNTLLIYSILTNEIS